MNVVIQKATKISADLKAELQDINHKPPFGLPIRALTIINKSFDLCCCLVHLATKQEIKIAELEKKLDTLAAQSLPVQEAANDE